MHEIEDTSFYIIDDCTSTRWGLSKSLCALGTVHPLELLDEIGNRIDSAACFLVRDAGCQLEKCLELAVVREFQSPVLAYSPKPKMERVIECMNIGAAGYFECGRDQGFGVEQIAAILARQYRVRERRQRKSEAVQRLGVLSDRELQVLAAVCQGSSAKAIARTLSVSPRTIEAHRANINRKLDVDSSIGAVRIAFQAELV